jgi:alkanesulfonate monooxygenase SsuD/methylene tetrahydromethanopterin reductase-like flavin-dependent oxidoreductase (luciferase family)
MFFSDLMEKIEFGVFLVPEGHGFDALKKQALTCDALKYQSLWISDHLLGMYNSPLSPRYECWTLVTALATLTKKIKMGQLTLAVPFRNPALLAKMAATLDVMTGGRMILSIGAGWHKREFESYGYHLGSKQSRIKRLDEAAQIIKLLWNEEAPSFKGRYYEINEAYCNPKPVQKPYLPLMIAGGGEQLTLRTVARYADMSNYATWVGTPSEFRHKTEILNEHCDKVGRNPEEIKKTWASFVIIDENLETVKKNARKFYSSVPWARKGGLIGTPETIIQQIAEYIDEGVSQFILSFLGGDWEKEANLFTDKVMLEF